MLIGLGYKARSGKDTVADILVRRAGFQKAAFADALKDACARVFGFSLPQLYGDQKEVVDTFWNATPREVLQRVGTECFRHGFADDIWIRALWRRIKNRAMSGRANIVVTDVRFPNEAAAIQSWGGRVIRVDRPGAAAKGGVQNHASETSMELWSGWDGVIVNDGTLADLEDAVAKFLDLPPAHVQLRLPIEARQ